MSIQATINATAARFLEQRDLGRWTETDQHALDTWLGEADAHCAAFWRLEAVWADADRLCVTRAFGKPQQPAPRRTLWPVLRRSAAAAFVIAALTGAWLLQPEGDRYSTPTGGREVITLFDGSQVELNTDTVVRIAANKRMAWVEQGEAFFNIKHNAKSPFIVITREHRIVDLGTKFSVRDEAGRIQVSLVEGSARVEQLNDPASGKTAVLKPGDIAIATPNAITVRKTTEKHLASELGWRHGVLIFDYTTLADAVAEFNRYNRKKIELSADAPAHMTMVGTFPVNDVELFGRVAKLVLKVNVVHHGDKIVISR